MFEWTAIRRGLVATGLACSFVTGIGLGSDSQEASRETQKALVPVKAWIESTGDLECDFTISRKSEHGVDVLGQGTMKVLSGGVLLVHAETGREHGVAVDYCRKAETLVVQGKDKAWTALKMADLAWVNEVTATSSDFRTVSRTLEAAVGEEEASVPRKAGWPRASLLQQVATLRDPRSWVTAGDLAATGANAPTASLGQGHVCELTVAIPASAAWSLDGGSLNDSMKSPPKHGKCSGSVLFTLEQDRSVAAETAVVTTELRDETDAGPPDKVQVVSTRISLHDFRAPTVSELPVEVRRLLQGDREKK